jgi:hypothetical protein
MKGISLLFDMLTILPHLLKECPTPTTFKIEERIGSSKRFFSLTLASVTNSIAPMHVT